MAVLPLLATFNNLNILPRRVSREKERERKKERGREKKRREKEREKDRIFFRGTLFAVG